MHTPPPSPFSFPLIHPHSCLFLSFYPFPHSFLSSFISTIPTFHLSPHASSGVCGIHISLPSAHGGAFYLLPSFFFYLATASSARPNIATHPLPPPLPPPLLSPFPCTSAFCTFSRLSMRTLRLQRFDLSSPRVPTSIHTNPNFSQRKKKKKLFLKKCC